MPNIDSESFAARLQRHERAALEQQANASSTCLAAWLADAVFNALKEHVGSTKLGADSSVAVVVLGAVARRERSPQSDLDLVVLHRRQAPVREHLDALLYPLWDAKLEVGHGVRTVRQAIFLAQQDDAALTAHLGPRLVAGDASLVTELLNGYRTTLQPRLSSYIERQTSLALDRSSQDTEVCVLEPELKLGPGGLRVLHQMRWVCSVQHAVFDRLLSLGELRQIGLLEQQEYVRLVAAQQHALRARYHLHLLARRRQDKLIFEWQGDVAQLMYGKLYINDSPRVAIEHLLTRHYRHARDVIDLSRRVLWRLVDRREKSSRSTSGAPPAMSQERLACDSPAATANGVDEEPVHVVCRWLARLWLALESNERLSDRELDGMMQEGVGLPVSIAHATQWHDQFLAILRHERGDRAFFDLHQAGLLAKLIPEFASATLRVVADLYHRYTVDVHTLHVLRRLYALRRGEGEQPFCSIVANESSFTALVFACWFHDAGKGSGRDHSEVGAELVEKLMRRLGCSFDDIEESTYLVREHLTLMKVSQRRDLSDPALIQDLSKSLGSLGRLDRLYVLSYIDTSETAPTLWTPWKAALLAELHRRVSECLRPGDSSGLGERLSRVFSAEELATLHALQAQSGGVVSGPMLHDRVPLYLVSRDRPGLLWQVAHACARHAASIESADLGSIGNSAADRFFIRAENHRLPALMAELQLLVLAPAGGATPRPVANLPLDHSWRRPALLPETMVSAVGTSDIGEIVEVTAPNRPGLLADLASAIFRSGYSITAARIATEGVRAIDTFYVRPQNETASRLADLCVALKLAARVE